MHLDEIRQLLVSQAAEPTVDLALLERLATELPQTADGASLLPNLFQVLEAHPDEDFGMPGPLVHAAEKFLHQGYERALTESVHRSPNFYNLWMLNRLINGVTGERKTELQSLMRFVSGRTDLKPAVTKIAADFLRP